MVDKYHIYMTSNGRISIAGITKDNVEYVAQSMKECIEKY
jgi:aspartate/tyrosine/aromatic aminotransferase|tara:strand:- start:20 stop:139 length:120 start_codon:yes stop_codon:yes gene_type:complete